MVVLANIVALAMTAVCSFGLFGIEQDMEANQAIIVVPHEAFKKLSMWIA